MKAFFLLLLLGGIAFAGVRIGQASQTCTLAQQRHHVIGSFSWFECVKWNSVHAEDDDR